MREYEAFCLSLIDVPEPDYTVEILHLFLKQPLHNLPILERTSGAGREPVAEIE
jgi:hypothetical protein